MQHPAYAPKPKAQVTYVIKDLCKWIFGITQSALILSVMLFIVLSFYLYSSVVNLDSFFFVFLVISLLTDGLFLGVHLFRSKVTHKSLAFDPAKLTILICCYNGEEVLGKTIEQAKVHVPSGQIIVVSDASTDGTAELARSYGVRVIVNSENLNKAFSINDAVKYVHTPYVLLLDDDTLIGDTFIPTSLLDKGYSAVAFNVMPTVEKGSLLNALQQFEYRMSMQLGKGLRASSGAIGNISGAIGLYRKQDLVEQSRIHSGQFAGEDEQRTMLTHISSHGKGITYTDSLVLTEPPSTYKSLFRQRAFSWSLAVPELFTLYWRILLEPRHHFLLKSEKAYQLYVYLTDPLRMLFFWALILRPSHIFTMYGFYLLMNVIVWLRLGAKDSLTTVILFPLYSLALTVCRFIGHFYWFKTKAKYLLKNLHSRVTGRRVIYEYVALSLVFVFMWFSSGRHFAEDMRLFSRIKSHRLEQNVVNFQYDSIQASQTSVLPAGSGGVNSQEFVYVPYEQGDTVRSIAHKAIDLYIVQSSMNASLADDKDRWKKDLELSKSVTLSSTPQSILPVSRQLVERAVNSD
jgi:cellulose synthase/poly-beta-1,6-N-acetylglucosamine synthase-like glycosyltransferase